MAYSPKLIIPSRQFNADAYLSSDVSPLGGTLSITGEGTSVGDLVINAHGSPTTAYSGTIDIETAGDPGTAKYTLTVSATEYGRSAVTDTWTDGAGATTAGDAIYTGTAANIRVSRPCWVDTDGDGTPDRVLVAVLLHPTTTDPGWLKLYSTTNFNGAVTWTELATVATFAAENPVLSRDCTLGVFGYETVYVCWSELTGTSKPIYMREYDGDGTALADAITIHTRSSTSHTSYMDCFSDRYSSVAMGVPMLVFGDYDGANTQTYIMYTWGQGTPAAVTTAATDKIAATGYITPSGRTVVLSATAANGVNSNRQTDDGFPVSGTWATYSGTIFANNSGDNNVSAIQCPDGSIIAVMERGADLYVSQCADPDGTDSWTAASAEYTGAFYRPRLGEIGGAIWCNYDNDSSCDAYTIMAAIWTASAAASWTSWNESHYQFLTGTDTWITFDGAGALVGDSWTISVTYDYAWQNLARLNPYRESRATDNQAVNIVFYAGANSTFEFDAIAILASRLGAIKIAANDTDSWGTPSLAAVTLSMSEESISAPTFAVNRATKSGKTWTPMEHVGKWLDGTGQEIIDANTADTITCQGDDLSGWSGDATIISTRYWYSWGSINRYKYIRFTIDSDQVPDDYYSIECIVLGLQIALGSCDLAFFSGQRHHAVEMDLRNGYRSIRTVGAHRKKYRLTMQKVASATQGAIAEAYRYLDGPRVPLALIPDTTDAYDWRLVTFPPLGWDPYKTTIDLEDV
jgi:hypothetical protein